MKSTNLFFRRVNLDSIKSTLKFKEFELIKTKDDLTVAKEMLSQTSKKLADSEKMIIGLSEKR